MLDRIAAEDGRLHAFVTVTADRATTDAARADAELAKGIDRGKLHGIPYALKDLVDTAEIRTTAQSRLRIDHLPSRDAEVAARLRAAGGVLLGKLATYEFATVGPDPALPFPPARNPRNPNHIPGGSSSGAAAAVAGGLVPVAIGTDTGGSIRSPACYCGVVGLKPTYGLVPVHGVMPLARSLDHVGPLASSVEDAALTLDVIAGSSASADLRRGVRGLRIGYARTFHAGEAEPEIADALDRAAETLAGLGAVVEEVTLPPARVFEDCGTVILQAEAFALHRAWLRDRAADYGPLAYQTLVTGGALTAADLLQAQRVRRQLCAAMDELFARCDAIVLACALTTAPRFDDFDGRTPRWTPMRTFAFNVTGLPALAVPIGTAANGLPIGMQVAGRPRDEATICRVGAGFEAARGAMTRCDNREGTNERMDAGAHGATPGAVRGPEGPA